MRASGVRKVVYVMFLAIFTAGCGDGDSDPALTCDGVTCSGHGSCSIANGFPKCVCDAGYAGEVCSLCATGYRDDGSGTCIMDEVCPALDPCGDHGTCVDHTGVVACVCDAGYQGDRCDGCAFGYREDENGECVPAESCPAADVCGDHGECDDSSGMVVCVCDTGYAGVQCSQCADGYHRDGETCVENETCPVPDTCDPNSSCDDSTGVIVCVCDAGYHPDPNGDCVEDEACPVPDPCGEHGTCDDSAGSIECRCDAGYTGLWCNACAAGYHPDAFGGCVEDQFCPDPDPCGDHGTCDDSTGEIVCACETGWAGVLCDGCDWGYQPDGQGNCIEVDNCYDYLFGSASYIYELRLSGSSGEDPCCFDFNGDGQPDNALGAIIHQLGSLAGIDFNEDLQARIESGEVTELIEYPGLVDLESHGPFLMPVFDGQDTDDVYDDNLAGDEQFNVLESSFVSDIDGCTAQPLEIFEDAEVTGGSLVALAASFGGLEIPVMPDAMPTRIHLQDAVLTADLIAGTHGIEAHNGKLGGIYPLVDFLTAMNAMYTELCPCLNIDSDLISWEIVDDQWNITCQDLGGSTCSPGDPPMCEMAAMTCQIMPVMILATDVDLDNDAVNDAFSVGFTFEATSAEIIGILP